MTHANLLAAAVLAAGIALVMVSLARRSRASGNGYELGDLLLGDDGRASKAAHVMFGSFFLTSWIMVQLTLSGRLTDGELAAYLLAWVTPAVTRLIVQARPPP